MWFKRFLLGHCATSVALTIATASVTKDVAGFKRHHTIETLSLPSLERRQVPLGNQTSSSENLKTVSSTIITSTVSTPVEISQTSTIVATPTIVTTLEPSSRPSLDVSSSPSSVPDSVPAGSSSSSRDVPSTSGQIITESTTPLSSATVQQPSETSTSLSTSSLQSTALEISITSTTTQVTPVITSTTNDSPSSSTVEIPSSISGPVFEPTSTAIPELSSTSGLTESSMFSSASAPISEASQTLSSDLASSSANEAESSTTLVQTSQIPITKTDIATTSSLSMLSSESFPSTPINQPSTTLSDTTSTPTTVFESSTISPGTVSSIVTEDATSAPLESTIISFTQTQVPNSEPTVSSNGGQSSSAEITQSSTLSTILETISSVQTIPPTQASYSSQEDVSSILETPVLSSSTLAPTITPVSSDVQPTSSSSEQVLSSSSDQFTQTSGNAVSSIALPAIPSTQSITTISSLRPSATSDSGQLPSSSPLGLSSNFEPSSELPSAVLTPESSIPPVVSTSISTSESVSSVVPTQSAPFPSTTEMPTSSTLKSIPSESVSIATSDSTSTLTPASTVVEGGSSSTMAKPTASIGIGSISSVTLESSSFPSLMPSETLATSMTDPVVSPSSILASDSGWSSLLSISNTQSSTAAMTLDRSTFSMVSSASQATQSQATSIVTSIPTTTSSSSFLGSSTSLLELPESESQIFSSESPTLVATPSFNASSSGPIPTSESAGSAPVLSVSSSSSSATPTLPDVSSFASTGALVPTSLTGAPPMSSNTLNVTQTESGAPVTSALVTATFSTVYVSSIRSSVLDLSTVAFSLLSSVTGAAVNQTLTQVSGTTSFTMSSETSGVRVPASESLTSSSKLDPIANSTRSFPIQSSSTAPAGFSGSFNSTRTSIMQPGITFSQSILPTGASTGITPSPNATQAETLQTSSMQRGANSTTDGFTASKTSEGVSSARTDEPSSMAASESEASTTNGGGAENTETPTTGHTLSGTPSQTPAAGSPPPLTTSQTAGVAVGATTGLLIAVVAAIFIARRYHAAKQGKRLSTGSIYPKVAYLYDPKTGGDGGDAEALMSGGTDGQPPGGPASRVTKSSSKYTQRHSMGTFPVARFTSPGNPFAESVRDPAIHRYSEYARIDTAQALSAAVAGYGAASRHSSSYTKHPSQATNPFSDHVIPSPTFAPFSPDDIRRPELKRSPKMNDGRGGYSQMPTDSYAYLNTAASIYPPISPYERPSSQASSPYDIRRHTQDSDPFTDPFEHDVLLQVDERNRTSDSVTIFAPSPNLMTPRTPRTPVGPKLPVKHANGMTSARSLLSPVAAQYIKAQQVKIPRKSVASPVLVQVGRSPVIKPFSPPPAAPEPRGWDDIKRQSDKHFSDEQSVPAPLKFASPVIKRKPVSTSHTRAQPSLTGAGQALLAGTGLPLTVNIPHMHKKSVGLDVPRIHNGPGAAPDDVSSDPIVREKRSRELRFAHPSLIGKDF